MLYGLFTVLVVAVVGVLPAGHNRPIRQAAQSGDLAAVRSAAQAPGQEIIQAATAGDLAKVREILERDPSALNVQTIAFALWLSFRITDTRALRRAHAQIW